MVVGDSGVKQITSYFLPLIYVKLCSITLNNNSVKKQTKYLCPKYIFGHFYVYAFNKFKIFSLIEFIKHLDNIAISSSIKCNTIIFLSMDFVLYQCFLFSFRRDKIHSLYVDDNCQICLLPLKQLTSSHECTAIYCIKLSFSVCRNFILAVRWNNILHYSMLKTKLFQRHSE